MDALFFKTISELKPFLLEGNFEKGINILEEKLKLFPNAPVNSAIEINIKNNPIQAAAHIDLFIQMQSKRFEIKAIYLELNDFSINTDKWYFDLFAYDNYGGHEDYDWLSNWKSGEYPSMKIKGLEKIQNVYKKEIELNKSFSDVFALIDLIIIIKFQMYIKSSIKYLKHFIAPILVSAHDTDFIAVLNDK
jgi:hypothetical protein